MAQAITRKNWADFDGVDAPYWLVENAAAGFCSLLNEYIPEEYKRIGCRYQVLQHFEGGLYFHLVNGPKEAKA